MSPDPGLDVLTRVRAALDPDPAYVREEPDGFTWWPFACAQRCAAEPPARVAGVMQCRVRAQVELVRAVEGGAPHFAVLSEWNARHPGLSALRWDGETSTVVLGASVWARADNPGGAERAARLLASAALLQLGDAVRDAQALAAALGGARADDPAPAGAARVGTDPLVEAWRRFAEAGAAAPGVARGRIERAAAASPPPWRSVRVDDGGLHAEFACGPLAADAPALLHLLTAQRHPVLGAGLLAVLRLPPQAEPVPGRAMSTAALLNEAEAREPIPVDVLGAWCVHPAAGLSHVAFLPALLDEPDAPERLAWGAGVRARWAVDVLAAVAERRSAN